MKKWLEAIEEKLATWWQTSLLRLPISFIHHAQHDAYLNGQRTWDKKKAWKDTLTTRRHRLNERERKQHSKEEQDNRAVQW